MTTSAKVRPQGPTCGKCRFQIAEPHRATAPPASPPRHHARFIPPNRPGTAGNVKNRGALQYGRDPRRIEIGMSVICAEPLEQAVDFVLLRAAHLQEREQVSLFVLKVEWKLFRQERHDGLCIRARYSADIGDPIQHGACLAFSKVHGMQIVDRSGEQTWIDWREAGQAARLI